MKDVKDQAAERQMDWGLREVLGREEPTDVTDRVLARARAGEVPAAVDDERHGAPAARRWLVAAVVLLATAVAVAVAWMQPTGRRAPERYLQDPELPPPVHVQDIETIRRLPADTRAVFGFNLGDAELEALTRLSRLELLDLNWRHRPDRVIRPTEGSERDVTDAGLEHLGRIHSLRVLVLSGNPKVAGSGLRHLTVLPFLQRLSLARMDVADEHLAHLRVMPALRYLDLSYNHGFTDRGMEHVASLSDLRVLKLRACSQLEPETLARVATLKKLEVLDLSSIDGLHWRPDVFFAPSAPKPGQGVTDRVVMALMALTELRELELSDCTKVHSKALQGLSDLGKLEQLGLRNLPELVDDALLYLPAMLRSLDLTDCDRIGDGALRIVAQRFPGLEELRVDRCHGVTDEGLAEVLGACRLGVLSLSLCLEVKPAILDSMVRETTLTELDVTGLSWWTEAHSTRVQQALPGLERFAHNYAERR